jgi:hypothetical protein
VQDIKTVGKEEPRLELIESRGPMTTLSLMGWKKEDITYA